MLENQLFPTPAPVIRQMLEPSFVQTKLKDWKSRIIDPQAGNGAILDYIKETYSNRWRDRECYAAEIDYQLREVLKAGNHDVIASDWLTFSEPSEFDLILSNPPFSDGAKHALKSIERLASGGVLAQLLNAESLRNPHTVERRLLLCKLAENWSINPADYGLNAQMRAADDRSYELMCELGGLGAIAWLGQCFKQSERPTDVEVVCFWYRKPEEAYTGPDWSQGNFEQGVDYDSPEFAANPLAHRSAIKTLVAKYQMAVDVLQQRAAKSSELAWLTKEIWDFSYSHSSASKLKPQEPFQEELRILKANFWSTVFKKTDLGNRIGSEAQKSFTQYAIQQEKLEFNERNIVEMLQVLLGNLDEMMEQLLVSTFDRMVGFHKDNRQHSEGWKTNAPGKIKKLKVIIPNGVWYDERFLGRFTIHKPDFFQDLDKSLCWVVGIDHKALSDNASSQMAFPLGKVTTYDAIEKHCRKCYEEGTPYDSWFESYFFQVRIFKKGTVHLKFKNAQVCHDFSVKAAASRRWLNEEDSTAA